jgi:hypothetical protein
LTFSRTTAKPIPFLRNLNTLRPRPWSGQHLLSDASRAVRLSPLVGMTPSRKHCPLGLRSDSGSQGTERSLLSKGTRTRESWDSPIAKRGDPVVETATSLGVSAQEARTAFGGAWLLWLLWLPRLTVSHHRRPATTTGPGTRQGSRGERKAGRREPHSRKEFTSQAGHPRTELTFRSFSGRYLHSRAISTYLSRSSGAILEITSRGDSGGGGYSSGGSGGGRSRNSPYDTSGP